MNSPPDIAQSLTNSIAAGLDLAIAVIIFFKLPKSRFGNPRLATALGVFFLTRATDRLLSAADIAARVVTDSMSIVLLIMILIEVQRLSRTITTTVTTATELAERDALTGLLNRRGWEPLLDRLLANAAALSTPLCVMLVDLDNFRKYNETHGHQGGDDVLSGSASSWSQVLRDPDVFGRYGGEEFIIALPGCSIEQARQIAERVRAATTHDQTCSIGVALWDGHETVEALIARADGALYRAKDAGRNQVVLDDVTSGVVNA